LIEDNFSKKGDNKKVNALTMCLFHQNNRAEGQCQLCNDHFCDDCLVETKSLVFCRDHFEDFKKITWVKVATIISTSETPEAALKLYEKKEDWWHKKKIPCYLKVDYALSKTSDVIESHVSLMVDKNFIKDIEVEIKNEF